MISGKISHMKEPYVNILDCIPQRWPIIMIDKIVDISVDKVVCQLQIKCDNMFSADGKFLEPGIIENIAQTIAAGAGYRAYCQNEKVKIGYIAAIKNLNIYSLPVIGDVLITTVNLVNEVFNISVFDAEVTAGNMMIAACEMRIFIETHGNK